jgi:hypothetical protein
MATKPKPKAAASGATRRKSGGKSAAKEMRFEVTTPPFVINFPRLFDPELDDFDREVRSATAIFNPANFPDYAKKFVKPELRKAKIDEWTAQWKELRSTFFKIARDKFKCTDPKTWRADLREKEIRPGLRDGKTKADMAGYGEGTQFFNMKSTQEFEVIDRMGNAISKEEGNTKEIYSGAVCRAVVVVMPYEVDGGRGITVYIQSVQKLADGPRIDNRKSAKEAFDEDFESSFLDDEAEDGDAEDFGGEDEAEDDSEFD